MSSLSGPLRGEEYLQPESAEEPVSDMTEQIQTAVIGGGISGLCLAHRLVHGYGQEDVVVLEASDYAGGHIRTDEVDGYLLDWGPNGFLDREPLMLEWVEELGLSGSLIRANEAAARRFLLMDDQLRELRPPPAFLFSRVLSPLGIARLLREPFVPAKRDDTPESIWAFAARRIGPEAADTLVSAMVLGVYGGDAKKLSLEHCFPRMAAMEREHGGLFRAMLAKRKGGAGTGSAMGPGGTLTTFNGGVGTLVKRATEALGDRVRTNAPVESIEQTDDGYQVRIEGGETLLSKEVVLALPAFAATKLSSAFDQTLSRALASIVYSPIAVVCTGYDSAEVQHDMDGFGYLVPPNQQRGVLGCIWTSSVFPQTRPDGKIQLRTMIGGALDPGAAALSDEELLDRVRSDVHQVLGISGEPEMLRIFRHPLGIPQYGLNHSGILKEIAAAEARHPGLYMTGNAYYGISMNDCVVAAYSIAKRMRGTVDAAARPEETG